MYNNTENSINAYGAYCIYNTAVSKFLADTGREVDRIYRDDIDFYTRLTDGRGIAALSGLERTIENRTVSLTDSAPKNYQVTYSSKALWLPSVPLPHSHRRRTSALWWNVQTTGTERS